MKMLRKEAYSAQRKMAAGASVRKRGETAICLDSGAFR